VDGAYLARTINEAGLSVEDVCAALKNRGGFTGNYDDLVEHVKQYFGGAAYQLCDGFAVDTGYFSIHPNVGDTFDKITEGHDAKKHPVTFRFRTRAPLRALAEHIVVDVEGLADVTGYIDEFTDITTGEVNDALTPGGDVRHGRTQDKGSRRRCGGRRVFCSRGRSRAAGKGERAFGGRMGRQR
jgi:hypothetical protein